MSPFTLPGEITADASHHPVLDSPPKPVLFIPIPSSFTRRGSHHDVLPSPHYDRLLPAPLPNGSSPFGDLISPYTANAYSVSLPTQKVIIWGPALPDFDEITAKIAKTGKEIRQKDQARTAEDLAKLAATA